MDTIKILNSDDNQVIHLPKAYHFYCEEVNIKKTSDGIFLIPKENSIWNVWENNLKKYDKPFMTDRNQPET